MLGQQFGGTPGQIALVGGHRLHALTLDRQRQHVGIAHRHLVEQRHGVEDRGEVVVAVVAHVADGQVEIHLAGNAHGHRTGGDPLGGGTAVGC